MILTLTTYAILVFIMYFYMYLLKSKWLLVFIVVNIFLEWIAFIHIFTMIYNIMYSYLLHWIYFSFIQYMCYKIY